MVVFYLWGLIWQPALVRFLGKGGGAIFLHCILRFHLHSGGPFSVARGGWCSFVCYPLRFPFLYNIGGSVHSIHSYTTSTMLT